MRRYRPSSTSDNDDNHHHRHQERTPYRLISWTSLSLNGRKPQKSHKRHRKHLVVPLLVFLLILYFIGSWTYLGVKLHYDYDYHPLFTAISVSSYETVHPLRAAKEDSTSHDEKGQMTYGLSMSQISDWIQQGQYGPSTANKKPITAYLEPRWNWTLYVTEKTKVYMQPLPLRTQSPNDLQKVVYPKVRSCRDMPAKLPIDQGVQYDTDGNPIVTNVGDQIRSDFFLDEQTPYCPVDADPYLPWIHDVIWSPAISNKVQFVAQNKRRCQTGSYHKDELERLEPQVALFQSVSVQRISNHQATKLAPKLWNPNMTSPTKMETEMDTSRYRLVPYEQADHDAKYTRFVCRFHTWDILDDTDSTSRLTNNNRYELGQTLSEYPLNYELADYRKAPPTTTSSSRHKGLLSPQGKDNGKFWTSTLLFSCPLPSILQSNTIWTTPTNDDIPLVHVDIIPIRTPARFLQINRTIVDGGYYLSPEQIGNENAAELQFDPLSAWGKNHVLPHVQASGRWENIPICPLSPDPIHDNGPSKQGIMKNATKSDNAPVMTIDQQQNFTTTNNNNNKPYLLSACLWASASFRTRGRHDPYHAIDDTNQRLQEWLEFHLLVGFDHIYVYDNSGAFGRNTTTTDSNLKATIDLFPSHHVTWIDWPSQVCNNNIPAHDNTGERSSQYAAENSCRTRYGPYTEWIASFDTDEYLIPQGSHTSLRSVVEESKDTNILSFRSSRGKLRYDYLESSDKRRGKLRNTTFLQAFNCDGSPTPRPDWAERARKQLYRADYVLLHFVHYSTVTQGLMETYQEAKSKGKRKWHRYFKQDPTERTIDEVHEAMMIHTKNLDQGQTQNWKNKCRFDFPKKHLGCSIGFPWPNNFPSSTDTYDSKTKWQYNCFVNTRVDEYWVPRLEQAMAKRKTWIATK